MEYPSWETLATVALDTVKIESTGHDRRNLEKALKRRDYPQVLELAKDILGGAKLLQTLRNTLAPKRSGAIYRMIAEWPVPVYLTTNYDDEIQQHVSKAGAAFISYSNSEDDMSLLSPGVSRVLLLHLHRPRNQRRHC